MYKFLSILLISCVLQLSVQAQSSKVDKANSLFKEEAYFKALEIYETLDNSQKTTAVLENMADSYRHTSKFKEAESVYAKVVKNSNARPLDKFNYAQVLQINGKCLEASKWYKIYAELDKSDKRALLLASSCDSLKLFRSDSSQYLVKRLHDINSSDADFGAVVYKKGLVFTSARGGSKTSERDGTPYLNMFIVEFDDNRQLESIEEFKSKGSSKYHDGPACFTKDFKQIYFTRNEKGNKGVMRLKLFTASIKNDDWGDIQELNINNDYYSVGHPSISPDGQTLYFTSDKGGFGGTDIFFCKKKGNQWSTPENMGSKINTRGNEMFPFITENNIMYFASNGHPGLGGLDIFRASFDDFGNCTNVQNMGAPINSTYDDFSLSIADKPYTGYFSSNRPGGMGGDDVFEFQDLGQVNIAKVIVEGKITQKINDKEVPVQGAKLTLYNETNNVLKETTTESDGVYQFEVESEKNYSILAKKDNYFSARKKISTTGQSALIGKNKPTPIITKQSNDIKVKEIKLNEENEIEHLYWDYNSVELKLTAQYQLNKVVQLLKDNPNIIIEIGSHTDDRGDHQSNMILSQKRAAASRAYVISKGIPAHRITSQGYGELRPIVSNAVTELDHAKNRRTEFSVIQIMQ